MGRFLGLSEQRVRDATDFTDARRRHRWRLPDRYNISVDCLDRHLDEPGRVALFFEDGRGSVRSYTFGELLAATNRFGNCLRALGIGAGDVVAIQLPQCPEAAIAHLAIYRIGAIALPLSRLFGTGALRFRLADSDAKAILLERNSISKLAAIRDDLEALHHVIVVGGCENEKYLDFANLCANACAELQPADTAAEDPALLLYTSGTTAAPKGVLHAGRTLIGRNGIDYSYNFLEAGDVYYSPADWAWSAGFNGLLGSLAYGVPVLAVPTEGHFDPERTLALLAKYRVTVGMYPPAALEMLRAVPDPRAHYDLALRCLLCTAGPVTEAQARWVSDELGCSLNVAFGQTEASVVIGSCSALEPLRIDTVGRPYPGHSAAIVDSEGHVLRAGEIGIIAIDRNDPVVMKEYWRDTEATSNKFRGGWMLTGDLGSADESGWIFFHGREDDLIKSSGYRISPAEIEAVMGEMAEVDSCVVVGVPDSLRGQAVKAFVKLRSDYVGSNALAKALQEHVKRSLGAHEYPREIEFVDDFPRNEAGKVLRRLLRGSRNFA